MLLNIISFGLAADDELSAIPLDEIDKETWIFENQDDLERLLIKICSLPIEYPDFAIRDISKEDVSAIKKALFKFSSRLLWNSFRNSPKSKRDWSCADAQHNMDLSNLWKPYKARNSLTIEREPNFCECFQLSSP